MERAPIHLTHLSSEEKKNFRDKYDALFFDKDGTLVRLLEDPTEDVVATISGLADLGKAIYVLTDRCVETHKIIIDSIQKYFLQIKEENIISAGWMIVHHLKEIGFNKKIFVSAESNGLVKDLKSAGFDIIVDNETKLLEKYDFQKMKFDPEVGAVAMGLDFNLTFRKIYKIVNYLRDPDVLFIVSQSNHIFNADPILPSLGSLTLPIINVTGRKPTVCGKSGPIVLKFIKGLGYDMKRCLIVGDCLESDITCGNQSGMDSLLVLSGVSNMDNVEQARRRGDSLQVPTYVADSVTVLRDIYGV